MFVTPLLLALLRVLTGELLTGPGALTAAALLLLTAAVAVTLTTVGLPGARTPAAVHAAALRRRAYRTAYLSRATRTPRPRAPHRDGGPRPPEGPSVLPPHSPDSRANALVRPLPAPPRPSARPRTRTSVPAVRPRAGAPAPVRPWRYRVPSVRPPSEHRRPSTVDFRRAPCPS
ncbi:hypothetical protein HUT16_12005 [Kitasatospora sp. NA04385]|uniref:hypothetical protein n=1 Tax=Kitasatospora sp. NA04385 TaxID=2742135 RepID=UPI001592608D|nr:hypothetical protein [Kitasatospora sp. NA04385]QKW19687.1 hypothetical protein HUT16_12005 [Kitasatospora sp. NA04385]